MEKSWQIAERIWEADLTPTEKLVALAILKYRNSQTGKCFPSRERIAETCTLSVRVVQRAVARLKEIGLVRQCGMMGRFALMEFPPVVHLGVMGDVHDTPGVTPATPQAYTGPFRMGVGEETEMDE